MDKRVKEIISDCINNNTCVKVIFSSGKNETKKISFKPIKIKDAIMYQQEIFKNNQVFHKNLTKADIIGELCDEIFTSFKQVNIFATDKNTNILISKKGKVTIKTDKSSTAKIDLSHDRQKSYIFSEGEDIEPLRDLGIFTTDNKIVKSKFDKYKQINRFIEIIDDEFKNFSQKSITIMDFGCGKSYLTFLVYYYFSVKKNIDITVLGYDLKTDVVADCNRIAKKYGYSGLNFIVADVKKSTLIDYNVDAIMTLHACDTATDYALYNAIVSNVKYIFSVPCCQHEINAQISSNDEMDILLQDGLIKERFSSLLTDSIRCEILRQKGYSVDVLEFVDFSHSPKNLMIRAKLDKEIKNDFSKLERLQEKFGISQKLFTLIK